MAAQGTTQGSMPDRGDMVSAVSRPDSELGLATCLASHPSAHPYPTPGLPRTAPLGQAHPATASRVNSDPFSPGSENAHTSPDLFSPGPAPAPALPPRRSTVGHPPHTQSQPHSPQHPCAGPPLCLNLTSSRHIASFQTAAHSLTPHLPPSGLSTPAPLRRPSRRVCHTQAVCRARPQSTQPRSRLSQ